MSGRNPPSYCTLTLIAMQGHQTKGKTNNTSSNNKDKSNTIIETRTAEDHDDENLHNPETVVVVVVVFFTLTDRASTIPSINTRGCQSGTWSAGQKKDQRNIYQAPMRAKKNTNTQTTKR